MHFLLTNDDGIDAAGLAVLEQVVEEWPGARCTIVAPAIEQSQCGHRVTTRDPIAVTKRATNRYRVEGTPADCVRLAIFEFGIRPDFVISGVNAGGNMGQDLYISGTVAGAREAAFHGIPAAAFSHYLIHGRPLNWERIRAWTMVVLRELLTHPLSDGEFWNVNYPHLAPGDNELPLRITCPPCRAPLSVSYETAALGPALTTHRYNATYASRPVEPDSDVAVCFAGQVAVSRLRI